MSKKEEFYQFKLKRPFDTNINELTSKLKDQGLYSSGTAVIVGDLIINGVIEERINKSFLGATVPDVEH